MPQSQLSEKEKVKIAISSGCHKFRSAKTSNVSSKEHADGVSYSTNVFPFQLDWDITSTFHLSGFLSDFLLLGILSICTPQLGLLLHPFDEGWFGVWQNWGSLVAQMVNNVGCAGSISGSRRCPGEGSGNPFWYSCLENSTDRGALVGYSPWGHNRVGHN